jgi:hypothetical protein
MARSQGIIKVEIWEQGSDFRRLSKDAQRIYFLLFSQGQINNCGVLPYTPERWVRFAADDSTEDLQRALAELRFDRYIVIDEDTGELLVRTFIKHDKIAEHPYLAKAAVREFKMIESATIRLILAEQHPDLFTAEDPNQLRLEVSEKAHRDPHQEAHADAL